LFLKDGKITDAANESRDNVKYLYTLDKFFSSMTKASPAAITESIPSLMNAVRMIHSISQYYNSSERMTSLFLKITNQMINTCKKYIREGYAKLWDIPRAELLDRVNESKRLYQEYQRGFQRTREKLKSMENERQWDFSENYIFGKFEAFCKRLDKIADVITAIESLSALNYVKLEGLEPATVKYKNIVEGIRKKNYDVLDHRKPDFENDYNDFKSQVDALQLQLQTYIDTWNRNSYTAEQSLDFLEKFQRLDGLKIDYNGQYSKLLQEYSRELDTVKKLYEKNKTDPVLPRNLPPMSGRIAWSRQLYRRISEPIKQFAKRPELLKSEEGKQIVRNYNKLSQVLLEYEMVHYQSWSKSIDMITDGLNSSLLVKDPETNEILVNFDPLVHELLKEAVYMQKMNLDISDNAKNLILLQPKIESHFSQTQDMLKRYTHLLDRVPKDLLPLMKPNKENVDLAVRPGMISVTWASTNIGEYLSSANEEIALFEHISDQVKDILECRVENVLGSMAVTSLSDAPADPCTIDEFTKITEETIQKGVQSLSKFIGLSESAVVEILDTLKKHLKESDRNLVRVSETEYYDCTAVKTSSDGKNRAHRCYECLACNYFNFLTQYTQRNNEALIQCN
jgi:dynein heavy chain